MEDSRPIEQRRLEAPIRELASDGGILVYVDERGVGRIGDTEWHIPLEGARSVTLAPEHSLLAVTTADGTLTAHDMTDGSPRWRHDAGSPITRPVVAGERVFLVERDFGLIALRVTDGRRLWRLGTTVEGAPAFAQDLVWVAGFDARLQAFKAGNGTLMGDMTIDLSSRNYLDLSSYDPWVVAGPLYGPWLAVRGPTRAERPNLTVQVQVRQPTTEGRPDLSIPAGVGPAGVAVVNGDGSLAFLQPRRLR